MIISDLSHFEAISEARDVIGGGPTTVIPSFLLVELPANLRKRFLGSKGVLVTRRVRRNGASVTTTAGLFKKGKLKASFSKSRSVSSDE